MAQADLRVSVILIAVNVRFGVADCLTLNGSNRPGADVRGLGIFPPLLPPFACLAKSGSLTGYSY